MSENKLATPIIQQIKAVMSNKKYKPKTRCDFLRDVSYCVAGWIVTITRQLCEDDPSRSQYEHLNGELTNGRSE